MPKIQPNFTEQVYSTPVPGTQDVGEASVLRNNARSAGETIQGVKSVVSPIAQFTMNEFKRNKQLAVASDTSAATARLKGANDRLMMKAERLDPNGNNYEQEMKALLEERNKQIDEYVNGYGEDGIKNIRYPEARQAIDQTRSLFDIRADEALRTQALQQSFNNTENKIKSTINEVVQYGGPESEQMIDEAFAEFREAGMSEEEAGFRAQAAKKAVAMRRAQEAQKAVLARADENGYDWAASALEKEVKVLRSNDPKYKHLSDAEKDEVEIKLDEMRSVFSKSADEAQKLSAQQAEASKKQARNEAYNEATKGILQGQRYNASGLIDAATVEGEFDADLADDIRSFQKTTVENQAGVELTYSEKQNIEDNQRSEFKNLLDYIVDGLFGGTKAYDQLQKMYNEKMLSQSDYDKYLTRINGDYSQRDKQQIQRLRALIEATGTAYFTEASQGLTQREYDRKLEKIDRQMGENPDLWGPAVGSGKLSEEQINFIIEDFFTAIESPEYKNMKPNEADEMFRNILFPLDVSIAKMPVEERLGRIIQEDRRQDAAQEIGEQLDDLTN